VNVSVVSDVETASTCEECAEQRAMHLAVLGCKSVLELCVGPSLHIFERAYSKHSISVTGNDIDRRWKSFYPKGRWLIGDCLDLKLSGFDAIVFAPPLSRGCTGTREDSLMVDEVRPRYRDFLVSSSDFVGVRVLVLPGRAFATHQDRSQTHSLLASLPGAFEVLPLVSGKRRIVKYHDVLLLP
jgi:hypothetical protein